MAALKVHVLIDSLNWGGAESLLADLASGAPAAGIDLTVGYLQQANGNPNAARLQASGVEPQLVGVRRLVEPSALLRTRRQIQAVAPDIVHTHLMAADIHGTLAARSLGVPVVSTLHMVAATTGDRRRDTKDRIAATVRRRFGDRVITVSDAARAAYVATGWDRSEHVVTVHNGIAWQPPDKEREAKRAELGLDPDALVVTMIAVLRPGKGHDVATEVVRRLAPRFPNLRLLIAGDGPSLPEVRGMAGPLGESVTLLGHRSDALELLGATDVLLHPTSMDAFPTVLLEAAAMGVPVLATAVGGIPEIVEGHKTGMLVTAPPTADGFSGPLQELLADAQLRARLGDAARQRFEAEFTATRWARRLRTLYDEVVGERGSSDRAGAT